MSAADLKIEISPPLLDAMGLSAPGNRMDYFALFALPRETPAQGAIEAAVMARSKQLRQWQSSPQFGDEVVALLKTLHRAAKILQDDGRREAYLDALQKAESGGKVNAAVEFRELVRAALVDSEISPDARRALNEYIQLSKLDPAAAQKIMTEVREEIKAQRAAAKAEEEWEFSLSGSGEEAFSVMLMGFAQSGQLRDMSAPQLMSQAQKNGISMDRAMQLILQCKLREFEMMVRMVAANRALSTAQAKLLADKAPVYGLDQHQASQIISEYTLTASDPEKFLGNLHLAETFDQDEITQFLEQDSSRNIRRSRRLFTFSPPPWLQSLAKLAASLVLLVVVGLWAKTNFLDNRKFSGRLGTGKTDVSAQSRPSGGGNKVLAGTPSPDTTQTATPTPDGDSSATTPETTTNPPVNRATTGPPGAVDVNGDPLPARTPDLRELKTLPDPVSGLIQLSPELPGDPPPFEIGINEVTNSEYAVFVKQTLEPPPAGWNGNNPPAGQEGMPVVNVSWDRAMRFVRWLNNQPHHRSQQLDLPSVAEFKRALRGRTMRTLPATDASDPAYWSRANLGGQAGPKLIKTTLWDKIYVIGVGQLYDLVGNVAEWGRDEQGGFKAVLGGDFAINDPKFNHSAPRWKAVETMEPTLGFRITRRPKS